jgi:hypothetical protein
LKSKKSRPKNSCDKNATSPIAITAYAETTYNAVIHATTRRSQKHRDVAHVPFNSNEQVGVNHSFAAAVQRSVPNYAPSFGGNNEPSSFVDGSNSPSQRFDDDFLLSAERFRAVGRTCGSREAANDQ